MKENSPAAKKAIATVTSKLLLFLLLLIPCISLAKSPLVSEEMVVSHPPFSFCHAPTLTETPSQKLICAFFAGNEEGEKDVSIWLTSKENGQKIWKNPEIVAGNENIACWNPVLFTNKNGSIFLFYKMGSHPTSWSGYMKISKDDGNTFSDKTILPAGVYGPIKNKPLLLSDNNQLLCPSSTESYQNWSCWIDITEDEGKTWKKSSPILYKEEPFGIIQPTLFQIDENAISLLCRSHKIGYICQAKSNDKGITWSFAEKTSLPNPNSGIDAVKLIDGRVLLVYNHEKDKRTPLNVAISKDLGKTWEMVYTLENRDGDFSYPAVIQTFDGLVHICYSYNYTHIKHVVLDPKKL